MKENWDDEVLIKRAMEELPMSIEMPQELKSKITDTALEAGRKTRTARRPLMVAGLTAGLAVLAMGAYLMAPKPAMAKSWALVRQAVDRVNSFQMMVRGGGKDGNVTIAAAGGKFRVDSGDGEMVYIDGSSIQVYDKKENKVTRIKMAGLNLGEMIPDIMGEAMSHISLKEEISKFEKEYGKENIRVSQPYNRDGRQVYDVEMRDPKEGGKALLTIDASTDLPIEISANDPKDKEGDVQISLRYNDKIDIQPNFPAGVKYEDIDLGDLKGLGVDMDKISKEISHGFQEGMKGMKENK